MKTSQHVAFESFERAFATSHSGCRRSCPCGREFYNPSGGWTWEEGELAELEANPKATAVEHSVGTINFDGVEFALDCDCWHERAVRVIRALVHYDEQIAEFLTLERARKQYEAERAPVVRSA
jgi:hypothetical protein